MGTTSTIPAAIDALIAALDAADSGFQILDGPAVGVALALEHILVGGSMDEDTASGEQTRAELGSLSRSDRFDILVQCGAYSGGGTQKAVRDRAYAGMAVAETVVRADPTLGGAVLDSQVAGQDSLDQRPPTDINDAGEEVVVGRKAVVTFRIACLGWIT